MGIRMPNLTDWTNMTDLINDVDARAKLAGSNQMEILLFSLGTGETFGVNVFKVREVSHTPPITKTPGRQEGVEGVISLRGNIIPIISLGRYINLAGVPDETGETMIVTEFSRHVQAFLVHAVDRIVRVSWDAIKAPKNLVSEGSGALVTAITQLPDGRLVSILDLEQILVNAFGMPPEVEVPAVESARDHVVFFADDSSVARKEIANVLDKIGVRHQMATNGREAWERLQALAHSAEQNGEPLKRQISLILTDIEMPEMDGYVLTKQIKADKRFEGIPVLMHSSLSGSTNRDMGASAGADGYIAKFSAEEMAQAIRPHLV